jgi:hypothetical protein
MPKKLKVLSFDHFSTKGLKEIAEEYDKGHMREFIETSPFAGQKIVSTAFGAWHWLVDMVMPNIFMGHKRKIMKGDEFDKLLKEHGMKRQKK